MNLAKMMKQAQELQGKMAAVQEELAQAEIEGSAGAGMVKAVMSGKYELKSLTIDPSLVTPDALHGRRSSTLSRIRRPGPAGGRSTS